MGITLKSADPGKARKTMQRRWNIKNFSDGIFRHSASLHELLLSMKTTIGKPLLQIHQLCVLKNAIRKNLNLLYCSFFSGSDS